MKTEFEVHTLNSDGKRKAESIANAFDALLTFLQQPTYCPNGRLLSLTATKLEEACFFAKKAMASQPENCE